MKRNLLPIVIAVAMALVSCGGDANLKITNQASIDEKVKPLLTETIGADAHVVDLYLFPKEKFTDEVQHMSVKYYPAGSADRMEAIIFFDGSVAPKIEKDILNNITNINISSPYAPKRPAREDYPTVEELDLSRIAQYLSDAGKMLLDAGQEYSGVGTYHIKGPKADLTHDFALESRVDSRMTGTNRGLATEITYYEFKFEVSPDGVLRMKE